MLCDTGRGDVQKSPIWGLGNIGGNADEVGANTVSTTQCPAHSATNNSTIVSREANTGEGGDSRGGTCMINGWLNPSSYMKTVQKINVIVMTAVHVMEAEHFNMHVIQDVIIMMAHDPKWQLFNIRSAVIFKNVNLKRQAASD